MQLIQLIMEPCACTPSELELEPRRSARRVLVVDDERALRAIFARVLRKEGYDVHVAADGREALDVITRESLDVVVTDIGMPEMDGVALLRAIRQINPDLPVIFATGEPSVETAIAAVEHGAVRYLPKPVNPAELRESVRRAAALGQMAALKRKVSDAVGTLSEQDSRRRGELEESFSCGLEQLFIAYQPILSVESRSVFGYEALLRTRYEALRSPLAFIETAERLDRVWDLSRTVRESAAAPMDAELRQRLFVNVHPSDLLDPELYSPDTALARIASRVVLELTERASLDQVGDVVSKVRRLREVGYRIAIDDLGAGYAGLSAIALLEPDVIKLDMSLIRDVHLSATKRTLIGSMVPVARDLGARVVAEGIESAEERDVLAELGCDLLQGYFFAKPGEAFPRARYDSE